jgi:RNA polymerase sigma factor (sigma-70 family)
MIAATCNTGTGCCLTEQHLPLAWSIARRLQDRYAWIDSEEIRSYSVLGLALAARRYDPDRGVPFAYFAGSKAMFLAIDLMRRDRVLSRTSCHRPPWVSMSRGDCVEDEGHPFGIVDRQSEAAMTRVEARDALGHAFSGLAAEDRRLLLLHYAEGLTFLEISRILGLSASAVSIRHRRLLHTLRFVLRSEDAR